MKLTKGVLAPEDLLETFNSATELASKAVVGREQELTALKICLLTGHHLLLVGRCGIAKSRFVNVMFRVFSDAEVFHLMLHGHTLTDEIFGVPDPKKLRNEGILRFNTDSMLPNAHFAYLDELFAASNSVLGSTLNLLNERKFTNGGYVQACPLMTLVATTNKVPEEPEMEAFLDRFLITMRVKPLDSSDARRRMLEAFIEWNDDASDEIPQLSLTQFKQLQRMVKTTSLDDTVVELMEQVRSRYLGRESGVYISDRRHCWAFRVMQAASLLHSGPGKNAEVEPAAVMRWLPFVLARSPEHFQQLEGDVVEVVGEYERTATESAELAQVEALIKTKANAYSDKWPVKKHKEFFATLGQLIVGLKGSPIGSSGSNAITARFQRSVRTLEELEVQVRNDLVSRNKRTQRAS